MYAIAFKKIPTSEWQTKGKFETPNANTRFKTLLLQKERSLSRELKFGTSLRMAYSVAYNVMATVGLLANTYR